MKKWNIGSLLHLVSNLMSQAVQTRTIMGVAAIAVVICGVATSASAHHSISMIDISSPIWIKGTVLAFRVIQPHVLITLEATGPDGKAQRWTVEGPIASRLKRMHADETFLKAGDAIEACGFPLKDTLLARTAAAESDGSVRSFMHGHLLIMPDGQMRLFGPYGKLDNCIRKGDQARNWVEFLAADPLGRDAWCKGLTYLNVSSVAPKALVTEINTGMSKSCQ